MAGTRMVRLLGRATRMTNVRKSRTRDSLLDGTCSSCFAAAADAAKCSCMHMCAQAVTSDPRQEIADLGRRWDRLHVVIVWFY